MTREEAIDIIQSILDKYEEDECLATEITIGDEDIKAFKMAIEALEQEPSSSEIPNKSEIPTGSDDCISRKAALEIYDEWFATCNIADKKESPKAKINALPSVTPQEHRWIPDSERLPEESGNYLVTYRYGDKVETQEAVYVEDEECKWFDTTDIEITLAVIAWMPLPKVYKAESGDNNEL